MTIRKSTMLGGGEAWRQGSRDARRLESWEAGRLGGWEAGRLGGWKVTTETKILLSLQASGLHSIQA